MHMALWSLLLLGAATPGCQSNWARMRSVPRNPLDQPLDLLSRSGPRPTARTLQMLRRYDLSAKVDGDPEELLANVQQVADVDPRADNVYAVAELAYIAGKKIEARGERPLALDMYGTAVANAYFYLLDEEYDGGRNPYDPRFRRACDLYNVALESALRIIQRQGLLKPGEHHTVRTARQEFDFTIEARGPWPEDSIAELKFVTDFEVEGLTNHYNTYGLGVPLIAVYQNTGAPEEAYYPPGMSFPVTAFLRVLPELSTRTHDRKLHHHCVLELHDTLAASDINIEGRLVPLETDLTTPLAYCLDNPIFKRANVATRGLVSPEQTRQGLYMLEMYDRDKIPVLMIHGFWSSLITWMEMFNDLRGAPEIRDRYQFWFYHYPTGQPFWTTAAQLRQELYRGLATLDPNRQSRSLDQMVVVGHSMGGLIGRMQTIESRDNFWHLVSDQPFSDFQASPEMRTQLAKLLFFRPNESIRRLIMIATPHRGSTVSNGATQWIGRRIINLPQRLVDGKQSLFANHPELFGATSLLQITTSIDSLAPDSPILPVILGSPQAPWVKSHNIVGLLDEKGVIGKVAGGSDGVVGFDSAHLDQVDSEIVVRADHLDIHRHPRTILEVQRILREHLQELAHDTHAPH